jgi:predicted unusual protein kinase regulating ubiquinone biosynthesis (AarF/ABC1/UbiB family)
MSKDKKPPAKELHKIKSSVFLRSLSMAKMTLNTGASLAGHSLKSAFSSKEDKADNWKNFVKSRAEAVSQELGELKGSLMKAGQMLSMYGEHFLPAEANQFLKGLQSDSPALKWSAIEPVIRKNLSSEKLDQLEIQTEALSCASLGQVHRAKIKGTGEEIVLKIQYPDVDKAIDSDLKALKSLLSILKLVPKELDLDPLFREVREMLVQETDYELEAKLTQDFYERVAKDPRYVVAKVYPQFSNRRVLATSYEPSLRADSTEVQTLPENRRNKIALDFLDLYLKELFYWHTVQTDPHIGNYGIRLNSDGHDQIVLYDFGATRTYGLEFMGPYQRMIGSALEADEAGLRKAAEELQFLNPNDKSELRVLFEEFCFEFVEPFLTPDDPRLPPKVMDEEGNYDWKNTDLPQRLSKKIFTVIRQHAWRTPPREVIFLDRKTGGVFIFMSVLRARCQGRELLLKYLEHSAGLTRS